MMGFEGSIKNVGTVCVVNDPHPDDDCKNGVGFGTDGRIYDHNACVWFGFACGFNYKEAEVVNAATGTVDVRSCFVLGLDNAPKQWAFLNTAKCDSLAGGRSAVFVARYLLHCDGDRDCPRGRKFGFFEAFDASKDSSDAAFNAFRRKVVTSNQSVFPRNDISSSAIEKEGTYHMFAGASVQFKIAGGDSRVTKVFSGINVPDISDWPFLDGDVLNSKGDGVVTFKNPRTNQFITWDFSDVANPKRSSQP